MLDTQAWRGGEGIGRDTVSVAAMAIGALSGTAVATSEPGAPLVTLAKY